MKHSAGGRFGESVPDYEDVQVGYQIIIKTH